MGVSKLERHLMERFSGSLEEARKLRNQCLKAIEILEETQKTYTLLEETDGHKRCRKGLLAAIQDVIYFGIEPLEAKYPELKDLDG